MARVTLRRRSRNQHQEATLASAFSGHILQYWSKGAVAIDGIKVPLQQALMQGRVTYWHSPGAMWLFLGVCAFAGSIVAGFLRGWLTQATRAETPPPVLVGAFRRNE